MREKMARWGGWFFSNRGFVPVPLFMILIFATAEYENDFVIWMVGPFFLILGEILRCWGIRHIGRSARTRERKCKRIVMSGPYALTRNPLYVGNLFIMTGFVVMSELLWILPVIIPLFLFYYVCIIFWEEDILQENFKEESARYFERVPRWFSLQGFRKRLREAFSTKGDIPLQEVIYREQKTFQFIVIMTVLLILKELFCTHRYPVWIPFIFN
jgi:protein-S-isoprenylcysteine O-methyltransferase Ste14